VWCEVRARGYVQASSLLRLGPIPDIERLHLPSLHARFHSIVEGIQAVSRQIVALLLVAIAFSACTDMGQEPSSFIPAPTDRTWTVPGVVGVFFKPGITIEQARQLVKDLNLEFKAGLQGTPSVA
jgi:hypothetical protein